MPNSSRYSLFNNSRFYILVSTILLSLIVASATRLTIPSDQLFYIRTQQLYGLICIFYWYAALAISPLGYVVGKQRMKHLEYARRAIGVSAAYFALLHAGIALWGQLGGVTGVLTLSPLFQWSLAAGVFGVIVLTAMAATSFDKVITFMTFRRWKWLHRLVYAGGVLAVLHIWSIGTHVGYSVVQLIAFVALAGLSGLEMFRLTTLASRKPTFYTRTKPLFYTTFVLAWGICIGIIASIPVYVDTYRSSHGHEQNDSQHDENHQGGHEG